MDDRSLAALTATILLLLQLHAYLLPDSRATTGPLPMLARHEGERRADLRRLGMEFAAGGALAPGAPTMARRQGPTQPDAIAP